MSISRTCDICHFARQKMGVSDVRRYTLRRETDQTRHGGTRTRRQQVGSGGIDLCGECWERICKPHMNPKKAHPRPRILEQVS